MAEQEVRTFIERLNRLDDVGRQEIFRELLTPQGDGGQVLSIPSSIRVIGQPPEVSISGIFSNLAEDTARAPGGFSRALVNLVTARGGQARFTVGDESVTGEVLLWREGVQMSPADFERIMPDLARHFPEVERRMLLRRQEEDLARKRGWPIRPELRP
jgi:hypothetical protein